MLSYTDHLFFLINSNVVYLNYSSIPAWAELGPAQPQLVLHVFHDKLLDDKISPKKWGEGEGEQ